MKIICVGRNYVAHARELNNEVPSEPLLFLKPETALLPKNHPFIYPDFTKDLHFEVELVLKINRLGKHIEEKYASKYYNSVGLGIDFTARDVQARCKEKGHPWEKAKAFDHSAPLGDTFIPFSELKDPKDISFRLEQNGNTVQESSSANMIFSFDRLVSEISKFFTLKIGDLIFTGTPAGVGPVQIGDQIEGFIENRSVLKLSIK